MCSQNPVLCQLVLNDGCAKLEPWSLWDQLVTVFTWYRFFVSYVMVTLLACAFDKPCCKLVLYCIGYLFPACSVEAAAARFLAATGRSCFSSTWTVRSTERRWHSTCVAGVVETVGFLLSEFPFTRFLVLLTTVSRSLIFGRILSLHKKNTWHRIRIWRQIRRSALDVRQRCKPRKNSQPNRWIKVDPQNETCETKFKWSISLCKILRWWFSVCSFFRLSLVRFQNWRRWSKGAAFFLPTALSLTAPAQWFWSLENRVLFFFIMWGWRFSRA